MSNAELILKALHERELAKPKYNPRSLKWMTMSWMIDRGSLRKDGGSREEARRSNGGG